MATGIAGDPGSSFDIVTSDSFGDYTILQTWVDEDSFDVRLEAFGEIPGGVIITLSDLDFQSAGNPVNIIGAAFDPSANGYLGFFFDPVDNPTAPPQPADPTVTWTSSTVTVDYGSDWTIGIVADQIDLRFNVQAVPEPGTSAISTIGLGCLGLIRRRNARRG